MGSINCSDRTEVGPIIDATFDLNYMMLGIYTAQVMIGTWFWPFTGFTMISWITVFLMMSNTMFQLGAAVDCAVENNLFGPNTVDRFVDFSNEYTDWAFIHFSYHVFLPPLISGTLLLSSLFTFGLSYFAWVAYELIVLFGLVFANLYFTNKVYEGFHPILAPQIVNGLEGSMMEMMK